MPRPKPHDLSGRKFGLLTAISIAPKRYPRERVHWICSCECGGESHSAASNLLAGITTSCGCIHRAKSSEVMRLVRQPTTKHGHAGVGQRNPTYNTWLGMKQRCYYPNHIGYHLYGALGVTVCDRWKDSFENFLSDMGEKPKGMSIDRIDPNGNYEPSNCRWATPTEQNQNKRPRRKKLSLRPIWKA